MQTIQPTCSQQHEACSRAWFTSSILHVHTKWCALSQSVAGCAVHGWTPDSCAVKAVQSLGRCHAAAAKPGWPPAGRVSTKSHHRPIILHRLHHSDTRLAQKDRNIRLKSSWAVAADLLVGASKTGSTIWRCTVLPHTLSCFLATKQHGGGETYYMASMPTAAAAAKCGMRCKLQGTTA